MQNLSIRALKSVYPNFKQELLPYAKDLTDLNTQAYKAGLQRKISIHTFRLKNPTKTALQPNSLPSHAIEQLRTGSDRPDYTLYFT